MVLAGSAYSPTGQSTALIYSWIEVDGDLNLTAPGVLATSLQSPTLVVNPNQLTPGAEYTFQLEVQYANGLSAGIQSTSPVLQKKNSQNHKNTQTNFLQSKHNRFFNDTSAGRRRAMGWQL